MCEDTRHGGPGGDRESPMSTENETKTPWGVTNSWVVIFKGALLFSVYALILAIILMHAILITSCYIISVAMGSSGSLLLGPRKRDSMFILLQILYTC